MRMSHWVAEYSHIKMMKQVALVLCHWVVNKDIKNKQKEIGAEVNMVLLEEKVKPEFRSVLKLTPFEAINLGSQIFRCGLDAFSWYLLTNTEFDNKQRYEIIKIIESIQYHINRTKEILAGKSLSDIPVPISEQDQLMPKDEIAPLISIESDNIGTTQLNLNNLFK